MTTPDTLLGMLGEAKSLAQRYYHRTGRPLGVTGEVAEYEATRLLGLTLAEVRQSGWDATLPTKGGNLERIQIKGRCMLDRSIRGQKLGKIDILKEWDSVVVVLLDATYNAYAIYRAERAPVLAALVRPGSKARDRGQLALSKFMSIGRQIWPT